MQRTKPFGQTGTSNKKTKFRPFRISKPQIPSTKLQITNKSQIPIFNDLNIFGVLFSEDDVKVWNFEFLSLGFVCHLGFVICNFHQLPPLHRRNEDELNSNSSIP
jgi:hypothetical protein